VRTDALLAELQDLLGSRLEATWLLQEVAHLGSDEQAAVARGLAGRRLTGEPLQYVLGHWPFRELDLVVDDRALVPRPETEQLVGLALDRLVGTRGPDAVGVDLGCGTGAIALSLATEGRATVGQLVVHATDLDAGALDLAQLNARRAGVEGVQFHLGSWYAALPSALRGRVAVLCSNPPYVAARERPSLARELDFEPQLALVAEDGTDGTPGFGAVEHVIAGSPTWLRPGGWLLVEHGEAHRGPAIAFAVAAGLVHVEDIEDLSGRPRFLVGMAPP
jgi:release factor glutamine methyltransferase